MSGSALRSPPFLGLFFYSALTGNFALRWSPDKGRFVWWYPGLGAAGCHLGAALVILAGALRRTSEHPAVDVGLAVYALPVHNAASHAFTLFLSLAYRNRKLLPALNEMVSLAEDYGDFASVSRLVYLTPLFPLVALAMAARPSDGVRFWEIYVGLAVQMGPDLLAGALWLWLEAAGRGLNRAAPGTPPRVPPLALLARRHARLAAAHSRLAASFAFDLLNSSQLVVVRSVFFAYLTWSEYRVGSGGSAKDWLRLSLAVQAVIVVWRFLFVCRACSALSRQMEETLEVVYCYYFKKLRDLSEEAREVVESLVSQVRRSEGRFSPLGALTVGPPLFCSYAGLVTAWIIVIVQII